MADDATGRLDRRSDVALDLTTAGAPPSGAHVWRIAHLSDVHVVGERYGLRTESGRAGARGNARFANPLDVVLVTGDMTDAGTSA